MLPSKCVQNNAENEHIVPVVLEMQRWAQLKSIQTTTESTTQLTTESITQRSSQSTIHSTYQSTNEPTTEATIHTIDKPSLSVCINDLES